MDDEDEGPEDHSEEGVEDEEDEGEHEDDDDTKKAAEPEAALTTPPSSCPAMSSRDLLLLLLSVLLSLCAPYVSPNLATPGQLRTRPAPSPRPLYSPAAHWVDDFYTGDVYAAFEEASRYTHALLLFYAAWDADSRLAANVLADVADLFQDHTDLYVAAVNCWTGACRRDFIHGEGSASQQPLPQIVFYARDRRGLQYHGPVTVSHLAQFLLHAQFPLSVVASADDLLELRARSESGQALVGHFGPGPLLQKDGRVSLNFRRFLGAAYGLLERDPFRSRVGAVGVVISPDVAFRLRLNPSEPVRLFVFNGDQSHVYPNKTLHSADALVSWALNASEPPLAEWAGTSGTKSLGFGRQLSRGSGYSLLAFVDRSGADLSRRNAQLGRLKETALAYRACSGSDAVRPLLDKMRRRRAKAELSGEISECTRDPWFRRTFCSGGESDSCACGSSVAGRTNATGGADSAFGHFNAGEVGATRASNYYRLQHFSPDTIPLRDEAVHNMQVCGRRLRCALSAESSRLCDTVSASSPRDDDDLYGLGCADNRTLNFYALDKATQGELERRLGLDPARRANYVIVDRWHETVYQLPPTGGDGNDGDDLARLVKLFHRDLGALSQLKRSSIVAPSEAEAPPAKPEVELDDDRPLSVLRLGSANFDAFLQSSSQRHVLLLYTTPSCGFCAAAAHVFHTLQHLLAGGSVNLVFASVDASRNDLPWHYTALDVPSVLFIPASSGGVNNSSNQSRAFPSDKSLTLANLLSFVVANLPAEDRLGMAVALCDDDCLLRTRVEVAGKMTRLEDFVDPSFGQLQRIDLLVKREQERRQSIVGKERPFGGNPGQGADLPPLSEDGRQPGWDPRTAAADVHNEL